MSLAQTFHPTRHLHPARPAALRLRGWLERLYRLYGQAALLGTHR